MECETVMDFDYLVSDFGSFLEGFNRPKEENKKETVVEAQPRPSSSSFVKVKNEPEVVDIDESDEEEESSLNSSTDTASSPVTSPRPVPSEHQYSVPCLVRYIKRSGDVKDINLQKARTVYMTEKKVLKRTVNITEQRAREVIRALPEPITAKREFSIHPKREVNVSKTGIRSQNSVFTPKESRRPSKEASDISCKAAVGSPSKRGIVLIEPKPITTSEPLEHKTAEESRALRRRVFKEARQLGIIPKNPTSMSDRQKKNLTTDLLLNMIKAKKKQQKANVADKTKHSNIGAILKQKSVASESPKEPVEDRIMLENSDSESDSMSSSESSNTRGSNTRSNTVTPAPQIPEHHDDDGYKLFIPKGAFSMMKSTALVPCPGCWRYFKKGSVMESAFFIHCFIECEHYKMMGLTRKCENCKCVFVSQSSFR